MPEFYSTYIDFSAYMKIAFAAFIAHRYFLKQFLEQRKAERASQITNQKDLLNKEIFDQITAKIENAYQSLSDVKKYCFLLKNQQSVNIIFLEKFLQSFTKNYFELHEKMHALFLTFEKYDFVIDPEQKNMNITLILQSELLEICYQIEKLGSELLKFESPKDILKEKYDQLDAKIDTLSKVCSKINLHLQELANVSKRLIKTIFDSLNLQRK